MNEYPMVMRRFEKWGLMPYLVLAAEQRINEHAARIYIRAICGDVRVAVKRIRRAWAHKSKNLISLGCDKDRRVSLAAVLHECAHILNYRKGKLADGPHGEAFCRTYARLLKEVL